MEEKPTAAFVLSLIGGIFVLLGGIWLAIAGAILAIFTGGLGTILGVFAIFGIIIIVGSIMMYTQPRSAKAWGIVVLVLGIISLIGVVTTLGGILSLIGGILAIVYKPSPPVTPAAETKRICPKCGRVIKEEVKFCPHCGQALE